jgi:hypothetical protein
MSGLSTSPAENAETVQSALFVPIPVCDAGNLPVASTYY